MKEIKIKVSNEDYKLICKHILIWKNINTQGKTYKKVTEEDVTGILSSIWKQSNIHKLLIGETSENGSNTK